MNKKPLFEGLESDPDDRYRAPRHKDRPYTEMELRVVAVTLASCRRVVDYSTAVRLLCQGLDRVPSYPIHSKPGLATVTSRCSALLERRLWKLMTGYGGEAFDRPPDAGLRDRMPLEWGDKHIIRKNRRLNEKLGPDSLAFLLGRADARPVFGFMDRLGQHEFEDEQREGLPGLATAARQDQFITFVGDLVTDGGPDIRTGVNRLLVFLNGRA